MARADIKDARRRQLIEATVACIARHGLAGTTVALVSGQAGLSRGIVNFYFESKDNMLLAVLDVLLAERAASFAQPALRPMLEAQFTPPLHKPRRLAAWAAFMAEAAGNARYRKRIEAGREEALRAMQAADTRLTPALAGELLALIDGLWIQALLKSDGTPGLAVCLEWLARPMPETGKKAAPPRKTAIQAPQLAFAGLLES